MIERDLPGGRKISAVYGYQNFYRDVTDIFLKHFFIDGKIRLPKGNLNTYFGDPVVDSPKILRIKLDNVMIEITEKGEVSIPVSD